MQNEEGRTDFQQREAGSEQPSWSQLRDAFVRGAEWGREYTSGGVGAAVIAAKSFYPKPKVERPRVVTVKSNQHVCPLHVSLVDGQLKYMYGARGGWEPWAILLSDGANNESVRADMPLICNAYLELVANPTEWVDAD